MGCTFFTNTSIYLLILALENITKNHEATVKHAHLTVHTFLRLFENSVMNLDRRANITLICIKQS